MAARDIETIKVIATKFCDLEAYMTLPPIITTEIIDDRKRDAMLWQYRKNWNELVLAVASAFSIMDPQSETELRERVALGELNFAACVVKYHDDPLYHTAMGKGAILYIAEDLDACGSRIASLLLQGTEAVGFEESLNTIYVSWLEAAEDAFNGTQTG